MTLKWIYSSSVWKVTNTINGKTTYIAPAQWIDNYSTLGLFEELGKRLK